MKSLFDSKKKGYEHKIGGAMAEAEREPLQALINKQAARLNELEQSNQRLRDERHAAFQQLAVVDERHEFMRRQASEFKRAKDHFEARYRYYRDLFKGSKSNIKSWQKYADGITPPTSSHSRCSEDKPPKDCPSLRAVPVSSSNPTKPSEDTSNGPGNTPDVDTALQTGVLPSAQEAGAFADIEPRVPTLDTHHTVASSQTTEDDANTQREEHVRVKEEVRSYVCLV